MTVKQYIELEPSVDVSKYYAIVKRALSIQYYIDDLYLRFIGGEYAHGPLSAEFIARYSARLDVPAFMKWLASSPFVCNRIAEKATYNHIFKYSGILLVYYAVANNRIQAKIDSVIPEKDLELIYGDLGISING